MPTRAALRRISRRAERLMLDLLMARYDVLMHSSVYGRFYDGTDFFNLGYWRPDTRTPGEASENLLDEMLALVPPYAHTVLDVACGMGATTRSLARRFPGARVVGINLSARQLRRCRANAPGSRFALGDATALPLGSGIADLLMCVEALPHLHPREAFLAEAHRVLAPSGHLVLSDVLFSGSWRAMAGSNGLASEWQDHYAAAYRSASFVDVQVVDVTEATWAPFGAYVSRWARAQRRAGAIGLLDFIRVMAGPLMAKLTLRKYLLVAARRA